MFTGVIEGVGPRYCPSIEDKITRFADKDSHQIFLEPEGLTVNEFYPNGISTSLPFDVQLALVRSITGLGTRAHHAARLRDRIRLLRSARAQELARNEGDRRAVSSPARSTARPATKKPRRRDCSPASMRRLQRAGARRVVPAARRGLSRRAGRRSHHARRVRALSHVHQPRRVSAEPARRQRRPAPHRNRPQARAGRRRALGSVRAQSAKRSRASRSG